MPGECVGSCSRGATVTPVVLRRSQATRLQRQPIFRGRPRTAGSPRADPRGRARVLGVVALEARAHVLDDLAAADQAGRIACSVWIVGEGLARLRALAVAPGTACRGAGAVVGSRVRCESIQPRGPAGQAGRHLEQLEPRAGRHTEFPPGPSDGPRGPRQARGLNPRSGPRTSSPRSN